MAFLFGGEPLANMYETIAACRDALVLLQGARRIEYREGDAWELTETEPEHPIVPRLRAVTVAQLNTAMPSPADTPTRVDELREAHEDMAHALRAERHVGDQQRRLIFDIETACRDAGMPADVVGREVLTWIKNNVTMAATTTSTDTDEDTSS